MQAVAEMKTIQGGRVPLQDVRVEGEIRDLMVEITTTQTYRNTETNVIEGVYTFPLPLDAVLLSLSVTLDERTLTGTVVTAAEGEERYEEAITDGDTAILLQQVGPGLYSMNVGNLQPGEVARVQFSYGQLPRWQGDELRLALPATLAPRYGDPDAAGLAPHQQPEYSLLERLQFSLSLRVSGLLARAAIDSPSHTVSIRTDGEGRRVELSAGRAELDRDFVLSFRFPEAPPASARYDRDGGGYVALASFKPDFGGIRDETPRSRVIVIDCSGSMAGDSIAQTRAALQRILGALRPQDRFELLSFGSMYRQWFGELVTVTEDTLARAQRQVEALQADMGGTELGQALEAACRLAGQATAPADILLITDGEVWDREGILQHVRNAGVRVFTVGVGAAVAEDTVRQLAETTGGACERVSPNENMAEKIYRHFLRMDSPRAEAVRLEWPAAVREQFPARLDLLYSGDTLHVFAWFDETPEGEVRLTYTLPGGRTITQTAGIVPPAMDPAAAQETPPEMASTLARLGIAAVLKACDDPDTGQARATQYQLISPWTHYLVVDVRAEADKAGALPELRKVPQMLAAGWGGLGLSLNKICISSVHHYVSNKTGDYEHSLEAGLAPAGLASIAGSAIDELNARPESFYVPRLRLESLDDLVSLSAPSMVIEALADLVGAGYLEADVVVAYLYLVATRASGDDLKREARRAIEQAYKKRSISHRLLAEVEPAVISGSSE